jgi:hypothetical protein
MSTYIIVHPEFLINNSVYVSQVQWFPDGVIFSSEKPKTADLQGISCLLDLCVPPFGTPYFCISPISLRSIGGICLELNMM